MNNRIPTEFSNQAEQILRDWHVIIEGQHFVYISGDHGSGWINKDILLPHTDRISELARLLSPAVQQLEPDVICGPAIGGLVISQWVAHHLKVLSVFAEHKVVSEPGGSDAGAIRPRFVLRRGFDEMVSGRRVVVVDDIINTGLSVRQTAKAVRSAGGVVVGAAALCSRGNADADDLTVDNFLYLCEFRIPSWPQATCHLCQQGIPINVRYAHGKEYVASLKNAQDCRNT
jgi:orotate phosphoribosyltransferase